MEKFNPEVPLTKYLFFTGKGGVGKTSVSSALAVYLSERGKHVALVSTDPASNLQDIFETTLTNELTQINEIPNLYIANFEPVEAANKYKASVIEPYIGVLPEFAIKNMEEQLSGSCTVEVAAFNEFTSFLANRTIENKFDHIIFDTAPTGHTLRMLELPDAWYSYIETSTHEASCLGQLSGLSEHKEVYFEAVNKLKDRMQTTMVFVANGDSHSIQESKRAMNELKALSIENHVLIINRYLLETSVGQSELGKQKYQIQQKAISEFQSYLKDNKTYYIPQLPHNIYGLDAIRGIFVDVNLCDKVTELDLNQYQSMNDMIESLIAQNKKFIFTMGKGGVGKTTIAKMVAKLFVEQGKKVLLATTDPANQWLNEQSSSQMTVKHIDEAQALKSYEQEVLSNCKDMTQDQIDYIQEDLRSPCTQEIAFFRAFSELIADQTHDVVVIDTAPTGHTLLLLDATQSYHKEIERSSNQMPSSVSELLPKITNPNLTEMLIVTLAEPTPIKEAERLADDLERTGIVVNYFIVNHTIALIQNEDKFYRQKVMSERKYINQLIEDKKNIVVQPFDLKL